MSLILLILVFSGSLVEGIGNQNKWSKENFSLYFIFGVLLIVAAAVRPSYMPDYSAYVNNLIINQSERYEPSFYLIRSFWNILNLNPLGIFFTYATFGTSLVIYSIKRDSKYYWFSLALFVSVYFILGEMIQIRQAVATGFMLVGIKYIYNKDFQKYIFISSLAIFFHYSAIIMLPLYFLNGNIKHTEFYISILFGSFIIGNFIDFSNIVKSIDIDLISNIYYAKTALIDYSEIQPIYTNIRFLIQLLICIFFWWKISILEKKAPYAVVYIKLYTIGLAIYILFYSVPDFANRMSTMFLTTEIIFIPYVIDILKPKWLSKAIIIIIGIKYFSSSIITYVINS